MKHRLTIYALAILAVAVLLVVAGCTTTTKTGNGSDSRLLLKGTFEKFSIQPDEKSTIRVNVTTDDGIPVDLLLLDNTAFENYASTVNGSVAGWSALASQLNTNATSISYTVNATGTYNIVVDNTDKVPGGAAGYRDVFVRVSWSYS